MLVVASCASDPSDAADLATEPPPDVELDLDLRHPESPTPQGIPVRSDLTEGPGHDLGAGFEVAEGSLLVGVPFPRDVAVYQWGVPIPDDGWTAVLLVTDDLSTVFERYLGQARAVGLEPLPTRVSGFCEQAAGITECHASAEDGPLGDGRTLVIESWQGTAAEGAGVQSHLALTYFETSGEPAPIAEEGGGGPGEITVDSSVPEGWPRLARVGESAEPRFGERAVVVPEGTALVAPASGAGFAESQSVYVVDDAIDPERLLESIVEQTSPGDPRAETVQVRDDGYDVWQRVWTNGHSYDARVFRRDGALTLMLVSHFPSD